MSLESAVFDWIFDLLSFAGIGPASVLSGLSLPLVSDISGVGQNLHDPIQLFASYPVSTPSGQTLTANPELQPAHLEQYLDDAAGPYSSAAGYIAFERIPEDYRSNLTKETQSKLATYPADWPEIAYIAGSFVGTNLTTIGTTAAFLPIVFSRGNVTIRSSSAVDAPVISPNWLSDPADLEIALAALKRLRNDIWTSAAADAVKAGPEVFPGEAVQTDEQMRDYIRQQGSTIWHACGTCAMGKSGDEGAVVDSKGRVFGVEGLRVCDASVFPFSIPGHPQAAVYALAEKIADDILDAA